MLRNPSIMQIQLFNMSDTYEGDPEGEPMKYKFSQEDKEIIIHEQEQVQISDQSDDESYRNSELMKLQYERDVKCRRHDQIQSSLMEMYYQQWKQFYAQPPPRHLLQLKVFSYDNPNFLRIERTFKKKGDRGTLQYAFIHETQLDEKQKKKAREYARAAFAGCHSYPFETIFRLEGQFLNQLSQPQNRHEGEKPQQETL